MKTLVHQGVLADLKDLETVLTAVDERELHESDSILIYLDGSQWIHVAAGDFLLAEAIEIARRQASERLKSKTLFLAPDPSWLCGRSVHPLAAKFYKPVRFDYLNAASPAFFRLAAADLSLLIEQSMCAAIRDGLSRCLVRAPGGLHFELPSKAHASHFVRLSEAFDSVESVQRAAYWIVASMADTIEDEQNLPDRAFLVDHPSMLLLGTHVNQVYGGHRNVLTLKGYPSETTLRAAASALLSVGTPVTAIIGIASTGRLAKILKELSADKGAHLDVCLAFSAIDIVEGPKPLARFPLEGYFHAADGAECSICESSSAPPIKIHGNSFFISLAETKEIRLPEDYFKLQRDFLDKYGAVPGALRVHFDEPNEAFPRHHAYGIDVTALLVEPKFVREVHQKLDSLDPVPDLIVIPNHKASDLLRDIIASWRAVPIATIEELDRGELRLPRMPTVLVFDDKIVTGKRMSNLNVALRMPRKALWDSFSHVHFFAPLVTSSSNAHLNKVRTGLTTRHDWPAALHYLYFLPLPEWHTNTECPWCNEKGWLEKFAAEADRFDSALTERLGLLNSRAELDAMGCLAPASNAQHYPPLGAGSVACDAGASQLQVLIATASAVQQRRTAAITPLNPYSLTLPTRMDGFVFEQAYTEKLIACSILRALRPDEVSTSMSDFLIRALRHPEVLEGTSAYQVELATALLSEKMGTVHDIGSAWDTLVAYGVSKESLQALGFTQAAA